ncbi:Por secretion system C-terminal sorting domain-containing protein [Catalinimonas alkaloidigena]|uniref:Por secretion system C-terminal sorting domain-containing protein n=1 Tax=Catalinimonas alkaloidigena TaxID=1075417 RepID=A0A1G8Y5K0_9BACT|nr:T9SS type A sorting domain-containing protein [Catalinimonas alkaloidigena]SDJ98122.1 Por secretion system C-terminal sorting domain-containing protein [Catalinimonas alkaloidigena]
MTTLKMSLPWLLAGAFVTVPAFAQEVPLVYDVENTSADCPPPPLPAFSELPSIEPLTDPFAWSDGSGRSTNFEDWRCRRAEIKAEIEQYEIGPKPDRPDTLTATYADDTLRVNITVNGNTLTLTSAIVLPEGDGPFPAVIGIGAGSGSLPSDIFASRDIVQIPFNFGQVMAWQQTRGNEPINALYPDLTYMGAYSAWSWGVSRLIDGLELVAADLPLDLQHLAITGCSFAGKMALFAGAFDERIALTIAQESGGGGAAAWRVSETLGAVETLGNTSHVWFMESMFQFADSVPKLPHDHHELMAMVAPRALLVLGNPDFVWLADESGYVSSRAAHEVWKTFGVGDRFGFSIVGGHGHCQLPEVQRPEVEAFVDKFLMGDMTANTDVTVHPYDYVDYERWYQWWGTGEPTLPPPPVVATATYEVECGTVGGNWLTLFDTLASNGAYVTVDSAKADSTSTTVAPAGSENAIAITFSADSTGTYALALRVNCPTGNDDSFWIKMDDGEFVSYNGLNTNGWEWKNITSYELTEGEHTLTIAYREDGALLDKISFSARPYLPMEMGDEAANLCEVDIPTGVLDLLESEGYALAQSYPNPFRGKTTIAFQLETSTYVSLKVYTLYGQEIEELAGREFPAGTHTVEFVPRDLAAGVYLYAIKTDTFAACRKMVFQSE